MYTTKILHKNLVENNAYITVNDPFKDHKDNPFRPNTKIEKQPFKTALIPHNQENGNFSKLTYKSSGYQENIKYIAAQPLDARKKGFGSHDASRRDEFSSSIRTEQYRETLQKELRISRHNAPNEEIDRLMAERATLTLARSTKKNNATSDSADFSYDSQVQLFDIGRTRVTPFDPKSSKDTFYRFNAEREKRLGTFRPSSCDIGEDSWDISYKPPQHGGKSEVKNFFDRSHLTVGPA